MITDLVRGGRRQTRTADICVIGAGTAGLTLVRELLGSGHTVVVLESGGITLEEETQRLYDCTVAGLPHRGYLQGRFRTLGGTSTRWGGQLLPLTALDIEHRDWIGAVAWPLTYADLQDYYQRVEHLFGVDGYPYESGALNRWPIHGTDFDANQFTARYAKWPPFVRRNLARLVGKDCAESHSVEVVLHANVTEISLSDDGTRVVSVKACTLDGAVIDVKAKHVVVATGTLETIRLLLASSGVVPCGIGNHSGHLGKNFQDHLSIRAAELFPRSIRNFEHGFAPFFIDGTMRTARLELSADVQRDRRLLSCFGQVLFETPDDSGFAELREGLRRFQARRNPWPSVKGWTNILRDIPNMCRLGAVRFLKQRVAYPDNARFHLQVDVEQCPNSESTVSLGHDRDVLGMPILTLNWRIKHLEKQTMQEYVRLFRHEWERLDLGDARWNQKLFEEGDRWLEDVIDVYHQTGGTTMSEHPSEGVADPQLRVHGVANLFLASCSVFPSAGSANPTFTLLALTVRLADHLRALLAADASPLHVNAQEDCECPSTA
ncbi:MAG: GMC family oxidoreductase [Nitrospira sp.]|nr:MAG: GMC family oxidoreductase [Nitrospira sp.]